jgi:hypothetical protein
MWTFKLWDRGEPRSMESQANLLALAAHRAWETWSHDETLIAAPTTDPLKMAMQAMYRELEDLHIFMAGRASNKS